MKLYEIANENFDEAKFEKDCAFYLEQMNSKAKSLHMFRGMSTDDSVINKIKAFRERSWTVSMPERVHNELNEFFDQEFHYPFRNGLFATGSKLTASSYGEGNPKIIVPVGKFEWICSPSIDDIYTTYSDLAEEYDNAQAAEELFEIVRLADWHHNKNLPRCISSNAEIMLWCPAGYYVFGDKSDATTEMFLPRAIS